MRKKPIEQQPSPSYRPGKVGVAIQRNQQQTASASLIHTPRRLRKLKYNDQLPLAGFD